MVDPSIKWSYANLWSSKTTWGGNDPPVEGDSVVITMGEYVEWWGERAQGGGWTTAGAGRPPNRPSYRQLAADSPPCPPPPPPRYIILDISPPALHLVTLQGTLSFARDVGDLALNASYIVIHYGR